MLKKILIIAMVVAISTAAGLFYLFIQYNSKNTVEVAVAMDNKLFVSWQKITVKEEEKNISINITVPRVIIPSNYDLEEKVNKAIMEYIELLKNDFIFSVSTAAENNGEINVLNIDTEILHISPRLISLAFAAIEHLAGIKDDNPERTFLVFDLINEKLIIEGNELFRDDLAWSKAVEIMKASLLSNYQEIPSCDLLFAPKHNGLSASCIGEHLSITKDVPISMIQEFIAPSFLSDIIK